jgi:hypothetical protein
MTADLEALVVGAYVFVDEYPAACASATARSSLAGSGAP